MLALSAGACIRNASAHPPDPQRARLDPFPRHRRLLGLAGAAACGGGGQSTALAPRECGAFSDGRPSPIGYAFAPPPRLHHVLPLARRPHAARTCIARGAATCFFQCRPVARHR
eukprot:43895-Chlamydomonas_euryale.AAC.1